MAQDGTIIIDVNIETSNMEDSLKKFGNTAEKNLNKITKAAQEAQKACETMAQNVSNSMKTMISSMTPATTGFEKFRESLKRVKENNDYLSSVTKIASGLKNLNDSWNNAKGVAEGFVAAQRLGADVSDIYMSSLNGFQILVGTLTGKIKLAEAATWLWNVALGANPVGAIATAIISLLGVLGIYSITMANQEAEAAAFAEAEQSKIDKIDEEYQAWQNLIDKRNEKVLGDVAEIDHIQSMWQELQTLVDAQGNLIGSKERVKFITEEINRIAPDSIKWINDERIAYINGSEAIDAMIQKKRAMAILDAYQGEYSEALRNARTKENEQALLSIEVSERSAKVKQMELDMMTAIEEGNSELAGKLYDATQQEMLDLSKKRDKYQETERVLQGYYQTIQEYEDLSGAIATDNAEKIATANAKIGNSFSVTADQTQQDRERMIIAAETQYQILATKLENGEQGITQQMVDEARTRAESAKKQFVDLGGNLPEGMAEGAKQKGYVLNDTMTQIVADAVQAAKDAGIIKSPSRIMRDEVGKMLVEGVAVGIEENSGEVNEAFEKLLDNLKLQKDLNIVDEKEYYKQLEELRDEYLKKGTEKWWQVTKEIISFEQKGAETELDLLKKKYSNGEMTTEEYYAAMIRLRDEYFTEGTAAWAAFDQKITGLNAEALAQQEKDLQKQVEEAQKKFDSLADKARATFGMMDKTVFKNIGPNGEDETYYDLHDYSADAEATRKYNDLLKQVEERGAEALGGDASLFFEELLNLSEENGSALMAALMEASDEAFLDYIEGWKKELRESERTAALKMQITNEIIDPGSVSAAFDGVNSVAEEKTDEICTTIAAKLKEKGMEIPQDFFASGAESAVQFGNGFADGIGAAMGTVRERLQEEFAKIREFVYKNAYAMTPVSVAMAGVPAGGAAVSSTSYTNTFNISPAKDRTVDQIAAWKAVTQVERMRGGY